MSGQIAGSFSVPGSFPSLAAAINTINLTGIAGPVTINIAAGYTETVTSGGLKLFGPSASSNTNTILFRKNGSGPNPLLVAYSGGVATPQTTIQDGIWMLIGCSYVTVDGIDLYDPNTTNPATMEFGYGFYKSNTSGNHFNTIKNCTVSLKVVNSLVGGGGTSHGSRGIDLSCAHYSMNTSSVTPTSTLWANSNNTIQNNLVQNCNIAVSMMGDPSSLYGDNNNDIGGLSVATSNTLINFGGGSQGAYSWGVYARNQFAANVSNNVVSNNNGSGVNPANGVVGIHALTGYSTTANINSNTLTLIASSSNQPLNGIDHVGNAVLGTGTININNNVFPSYNYTSGLSPVSNSLISSAAQASVNNQNIVNVNNNSFQNAKQNNGTLTAVSVHNAYTVNVTNNAMSSFSMTSGGAVKGIWSGSLDQFVSNNVINNISMPGNNYSYLLAMVGNGSVRTVSAVSNTITNISAQEVAAIAYGGTNSASSYSMNNNLITNFFPAPSSTAASKFQGIYGQILGGTGIVAVYGNTIGNITANGASGSNTGGRIDGIRINCHNSKVFQNKLYDMTSSGLNGLGAIGIDCNISHIYNNLIGKISVSSPSPFYALWGSQTGTYNVYYNTFVLSNTWTPTGNFGSAVITLFNGGTLDLRNNILVNTSLSSGTGTTCILDIGSYATASNNNLFYLGTPASNRQIRLGVPSSSTIAGYKTAVSPADALSFSENPPFITTVGTATNFLNITPTVATQIEGGAAVISTITTDYIGTARSNTPDVGAWEGTFTAADKSVPLIVSSGFLTGPCNTTNRTYTMAITDVSGVATGSLSPRLYYRVNFGLYTSVQGTLISGTATNGVWSFNLSYSATLGDVIWYFVVLQDQSYLNNILVIPATGATVTDVNNVTVPPSPANNYTLQTSPTISVAVSVATICAGQNFVIQPSGAAQYSYSGPGATVSPATSTVYFVSGASSLGCPSTNTLQVNITVNASPVVSVTSGSICSGQSYTIVATGAPSYNYQGGSPVVSPSSSTVYSVTGTNSLGCTSAPALSSVTVMFAGITAVASPSQVCAGSPVVLSGSGGTGYSWSGGVTDNVPFVPASSSQYTLTATGTNGCVGTAVVFVGVNALPVLNVSASSHTICKGQMTVLDVTGAVSYTWSPGQMQGAQQFVSPLSTTTYSVVGTDQNGCQTTATVNILVSTCVDVLAEQRKLRIDIYPNPVLDALTIERAAIQQDLSAYVSTVHGVLLKTFLLRGQSTTVDLSDLSAGVYILEIKNEGGLVERKKVIVEK